MQDRDTNEILKNIGRRIAELRAEKKLTQERFAEVAGITPQYLQRLEHGRQNLSIGTIVRIAKLLGATFDDMLAPPTSLEVKVGRPSKAK